MLKTEVKRKNMNEIKFNDMDMSEEIKRALDTIGFEEPTEIQRLSIPLIKTGQDIIGRSQTGTGKTIAFGIPAIECIDTSYDMRNKTQVLVLCPTRELAMQACDEFKKLSQYCYGIKTVDIYGGVSMDRQILKLKKANIVIGTPGRVMDHLKRRTLRLEQLKMVVLDEADEMLNMGFREDIEKILESVPENRQTVLFSATMPPDIMEITKRYQKNAQVIRVANKKVTLDNVKQLFYEVKPSEKLFALCSILEYYVPRRAIIFCNTKKMVDDICEFLNKAGFRAEGLHGDMKQAQRSKVMSLFKGGRIKILIATDVAARGIDVNDIDYVINYDIPQDNEYYVHRIGRTGRAGKEGVAITICGGRYQTSILMQIAKSLRAYVTRMTIPTDEEIEIKKKEKNVLKFEEEINNSGDMSLSCEMLNVLIDKGYSAEQIAIAGINLFLKSAPLRVSSELKEKVLESVNFEMKNKTEFKDNRYGNNGRSRNHGRNKSGNQGGIGRRYK